jgi:hypothetical protein
MIKREEEDEVSEYRDKDGMLLLWPEEVAARAEVDPGTIRKYNADANRLRELGRRKITPAVIMQSLVSLGVQAKGRSVSWDVKPESVRVVMTDTDELIEATRMLRKAGWQATVITGEETPAWVRVSRIQWTIHDLPEPSQKNVKRPIMKGNGLPGATRSNLYREDEIDTWLANRLGPGGHERSVPAAEPEAM